MGIIHRAENSKTYKKQVIQMVKNILEQLMTCYKNSYGHSKIIEAKVGLVITNKVFLTI